MPKHKDAIIEFTRNWNAGLSLKEIAEHIKRHPIHIRNRLALEFVSIDLRNRWQAWSRIIDSSFSSMDQLCSVKCQIPRWHEYIGIVGLPSKYAQTLKTEELISRVRFGDCPSPTSFGISIHSSKVSKLKIPTIIVSRKGQTAFKARFFGSLDIGRRDQDEPRPIHILHEFGRQKLVVVDYADRSISRHQLNLTMISECVLRIHNGSRNRAIAILSPLSSPATVIVHPARTACLSLPINFFLGHRIQICKSTFNSKV